MNLNPMLKHLYIHPKNQGVVPLQQKPGQARIVQEVQRQYEAKVPIRIIVLKARQIGISTIVQAIVFAWTYLFRPSAALTLAHDRDTAGHLLSMQDLFWERWPWASLNKLNYDTKSELVWDFGSSNRIATAGRRYGGRGKTVHVLHASEVAFWPDPVTLMQGLGNSVPDTPSSLVIMESTANGVGGYFYDEWHKAQRGETAYVPIFIGWFDDPDYTLAVHEPLGRLDANEKLLLKRHPYITEDQLAWRRWALANKCGGDLATFQQEYPSTPEEAFQASGLNTFALSDLQACFQALIPARGYLQTMPSGEPRFVRQSDGPLRVYRRPSNGDYMVAGDPTYTTQGDPAVIQVINRRTYEQVAVWEAHCDPISMAEPLEQLGYFFNTAMVTCEIEGPGYGTIGKLISDGYPRLWQHQWADKLLGNRRAQTYGWSSSYKRKEWAIGWLRRMINDGDLLFHDSRTMEQLKHYGITSRGLGNLDPGGHDDHVLSLAIAIVCSVLEGAPMAPRPSPLEMARQAVEDLGLYDAM